MLTRASQNVWCHMTSTEIRASNVRDWSAGQINITMYSQLEGAVEDLKGFLKAIREGGHTDIYDFTDDGENAAVEYTDKWTGKRMRRWVASLPFFYYNKPVDKR